MKDCTTCKYGYEEERLGIPVCHHPKRFSEDCIDFNMYEEKHLDGKPDKSLEEAADEYANKHYSEWDESWDDYNGHNIEPENDKLQLMDAFIAGAKWMSIHGNDIKEL